MSYAYSLSLYYWHVMLQENLFILVKFLVLNVELMDMIFFLIFETGYTCIDEACLEPTDVLPPQAPGMGYKSILPYSWMNFKYHMQTDFQKRNALPYVLISLLWLEQ